VSALTTEQVEEILAGRKRCPTCRCNWIVSPPTEIEDGDGNKIGLVRCVSCKAVYDDPQTVSSLATELLALRKRVALLEPAVIAAQSALAEYIVPDSGISEHDCVNNLLGILDDQDFVREMRALPTSARVEAEWQDISTAPIGRKIDLWLWNIGEYDEPVDGFRFPEVELIGPMPYPFKYWDDDGEPKVFHPDENGQFVSYWRDVPAAPSMALPTPKVSA
jgi:hypothetical protein